MASLHQLMSGKPKALFSWAKGSIVSLLPGLPQLSLCHQTNLKPQQLENTCSEFHCPHSYRVLRAQPCPLGQGLSPFVTHSCAVSDKAVVSICGELGLSRGLSSLDGSEALVLNREVKERDHTQTK